MILADVIGTVVSPSEQIPVLDGRRLMLVRPVSPRDGATQSKTPRLAIDAGIGAGVGDRVLVIDEGNSGRAILGCPEGAVKTMIVGFVDQVSVDGAVTFPEGASRQGGERR